MIIPIKSARDSITVEAPPRLLRGNSSHQRSESISKGHAYLVDFGSTWGKRLGCCVRCKTVSTQRNAVREPVSEYLTDSYQNRESTRQTESYIKDEWVGIGER